MIRIYFNPEGGAGGGGVQEAAPAAAPSVTPAAAAQAPSQGSAVPSVSQQAPQSPAPALSAEPGAVTTQQSTGDQQSDARVISRMPTLDTPEYWEAFNKLSIDERRQLESEVYDIEIGLAESPIKGDVNPVAPVNASEISEDQLFLTQEEMTALDPKIQAIINKMQSHISEVEPFLDEKVKNGMDIMVRDPIIAARLAEINGEEGPYVIPAQLLQSFNPSSILSDEVLNNLDPSTDPDGFKEGIHSSLSKAYERGAKDADARVRIETGRQMELQQNASIIGQQFSELIAARSELKPPDGVSGMNDSRHPGNKFYNWAKENYTDNFFLKNPNAAEAAYMAYQTVTGGLKSGVSNIVNAQRFQFIRKLEQASQAARTIPPTAPSHVSDKTQNLIPGLDPERYLSDSSYATAIFQNADYKTRLRLEGLRETGRLTT